MKAYVIYKEPEYEGGGSYYGSTEILKVFSDKQSAIDYCANTNWYYDYEEVEYE